ncbi:MAG TPA: hypothetical protein VG275_05090 [Solirubrobacteraceae bacterium]|jgi:hypothetical protein|nr:hypothetical protein [Solirubrobacteraceae bacterium]
MPAWLGPWLIPLGLAVGVIATAVSIVVGAILLTVACLIVLPAIRLRYLRSHPPPTELVKKPFWRF